MYPNGSVLSLVLTLHSLELPETSIYPAFIFGLTTYLFILLCNVTIVVTICLNRNLHKPMYILLLNMPINEQWVLQTFFLSCCIVYGLRTHPYPTLHVWFKALLYTCMAAHPMLFLPLWPLTGISLSAPRWDMEPLWIPITWWKSYLGCGFSFYCHNCSFLSFSELQDLPDTHDRYHLL